MEEKTIAIEERTLTIKIGDKNEKEPVKTYTVTPSPLADDKTSLKIFDMLEQSMHHKQLKKGANEVMKLLAKSKAEVVIMAADTQPIELLMNLPEICEEKSVPYCFVASNSALGRACGIKRYPSTNFRPVIACAIMISDGSSLNRQIEELKDTIEQLFY